MGYWVNNIELRFDVRFNFIMGHRRTKWTKNDFLIVVSEKYIIFKKIKI